MYYIYWFIDCAASNFALRPINDCNKSVNMLHVQRTDWLRAVAILCDYSYDLLLSLFIFAALFH